MKPILVALMLACGAAHAAEMLVYRNGNDKVRLTQAPCSVAVLKLLPEGVRGYFRAAMATVNGVDYEGCWAGRTDGTIYLRFADGDEGSLRKEAFKFEPGI